MCLDGIYLTVAAQVMVEVPLVRAEYKGNAEHWARSVA